MKKTLIAEPLTAAAFAGFGSVLMACGPAPQRDEFSANMVNRRPDARANLTFIHAQPRPPTIRAVERHAHSSQMFVPMNGARYIVGVCPSASAGGPDLSRIVVFIASGGQTVNYDAGTWHVPLIVLDRPGEFTMLRWDNGSDEDTETVILEHPIDVQVGPGIIG